MRSRGSSLGVAIVSALLVAGCGGMGGMGGMGGGGRVWIPQGPGDVPQAKAEVPARAPASTPRRAATPPAAVAPSASPFRDPPPSAPVLAQAAPGATPPSPSTAPSSSSGYTQATRYGDLLFVSGQIAINPATNQMVGDKIEGQTRQVMENIRQILEAHRLTMANVVSVTVYLKDLAQFRGMDEAYETFFRSTLPSRSVVEVARLPRGALVEISVIAGR